MSLLTSALTHQPIRNDAGHNTSPASAYTASGSSPPKTVAPRFGQALGSAARKQALQDIKGVWNPKSDVHANHASDKKPLNSSSFHSSASPSPSSLFKPVKTDEKVSLKSLAGPVALAQTLRDIAGVWAPKLIVLRSGFQLFEETFLEFVEDLAFYFSTALAGYGLHKPMAKLARLKPHSGDPAEKGDLKIGQRIANAIGQGLGGKTGKDDASKALIAAKIGTVLGALGIGAGFEFMIQHAKNVISAEKLHVRNFTAVAGLEDAQDQAADGETDPVVKAKRRSKQVLAVTAGLLGLALAAPIAVRKSSTVENAARKFLGYVDFGKAKPFDLSKPFLAILAGVGAWSYIDASRDSLERKENATRLSVVIPYMIFGTEILHFALAKYNERFGKIGVDGTEVKLRDLKKQLGFSFTDGNPIAKAFKKESFLDMNVLRDEKSLEKHVADISRDWVAQNPDQAVRVGELERGLQRKLAGMKQSSFFMSAALTGILINVIAYAMTRERYRAQQPQDDDQSNDAAAVNNLSLNSAPVSASTQATRPAVVLPMDMSSLAHIQTAPLPLPPDAFNTHRDKDEKNKKLNRPPFPTETSNQQAAAV